MKIQSVVVLCILMMSFLMAAGQNVNKTKIYLAASYEGLEKDKFSFRAAMEVATSLINKDPRILKDYEIEIEYSDTANGFLSAFILMRFLNTGPVKQIYLGPAFSQHNKRFLPFLNLLTVPQISYSARQRFNMQKEVDGDPVPVPQELKKYPYIARTAVSFTQNNKARVKIFQHFSWNRIAIVFDKNDYANFEKIRDLTYFSKINGITVLDVIPFKKDSDNRTLDLIFTRLKELDARIVIGFFDNIGAVNLLCQAYHNGFYGEKIVWFLPETLTTTFYTQKASPSKDNCKRSDILKAVDGAVFLRTVNSRQDGIRSISGLDAETAKKLIFFKDLANIRNYNMKHPKRPIIPPFRIPHRSSTNAFDAVYAAAIALDKLIKEKGVSEVLMTRYGDKKKALEITKQIFKSDFEGITGRVKFGGPTKDDKLSHVLVTQWRAKNNFTEATLEEIGYYRSENNELNVYNDKNDTIFTDGKIRRDGIQFVRIESHTPSSSVVIVWVLLAMSVIIAVAFLSFNVKYRQERLIKMSSPNMNSGIVFGCFIFYTSLFLYGLDTRYLSLAKLQRICNALPFLLSVGFTFTFGCMFSKTWRIFKIFTAAPKMVKVNTAALRDERLYILVFVLVFIDVLLSIAWILYSPFQMSEVTINKELVSDDVSRSFFYHSCSCEYQSEFTVAMYCYKGVLLVVGCFLAWETRKVKVAALNDSQQIGMAVYNVFIVAILGLICLYSLANTSNYHKYGYLIVALATLLCTNITILLVFVPKIHLVLSKNKTLERALSVQTFSYSSSVSTNSIKHTNSNK